MKGETILSKRSRILYIDKDILYAQIENYLALSRDLGETWEPLAVELAPGIKSYSRLHNRLMRRSLHCAEILDDGSMALTGKGAIYKLDKDRRSLRKTFSIIRGSRPLNLSRNQDGVLYWGEYFRNPQRQKVNIYGSFDRAQSWSVVYTFKAKQIRHIHGVFCDPYDNKIWVTTGDEDNESAIWRADHQFRNIEKIAEDSQQARALQLIFTEKYVYFGTDTPFEENHIFRISKNTGKKEELCSVDSSVYWGCKAGGWIFFSTAVEPSTVNTCGEAAIWGSQDGLNWQCIAKFKKDFWPMKYFQVGQILFPQGENTTGYLFYTPFATEGDQTLQRLNVADLI